MNAYDVIGHALDSALVKQPWYRRYANTITAAASGLVVLGTWTATTVSGLPEWAATTIGGVVAVAAILAQRATPNGVTPRSNRQVVDAVAPRVDAAATAAGELMDRLQLPVRVEAKLDQVLDGVRDALGVATVEDQDLGDVIANARARGWSEHDPRYTGLTTAESARRYLAALGGRHTR